MRIIPWVRGLMTSKGLKRCNQVPVGKNFVVGVSCHVDRVSDYEPNLADKLRGEFFDPRWCKSTGIKPVNRGCVDACLPYA